MEGEGAGAKSKKKSLLLERKVEIRPSFPFHLLPLICTVFEAEHKGVQHFKILPFDFFQTPHFQEKIYVPLHLHF